MKHLSKILLIILLSWQSTDLLAQVMANTLDPVPANWSGKVFQLSKNYPTSLPAAQEPWKAFDFKTQPLQYINAVKDYVLAGNVAKDWVLQNNSTRKWYHAPSMIWGNNGREFINGLTRERSSQPFELHPNQSHTCQNWAVGFYNPRGGYTLGRVYKIPEKPDVTKAVFPEGTVAAKLLFTNASLNEVPYLSNSFSWQANIHTSQSGTTNRSPATVRLLQMDIAVKDKRAGSTTDWVMITFAYNDNAPGSTPWEKLVPVGLEWGNDPASISSNAPLTQTWINPAFTSLFTIGSWTMHKGYLGRLNGPVDNPKSSCISCHGTAQYPKVSTGMIPANNPASIASYFRNINPPALFEDKPNITERTLDYSLQLSVGVPLAFAAGAPVAHSTSPADTSQTAAIAKMLLTSRDFDEQEDQVTEPPQENEAKDPEPVAAVNPPSEEGNKYLGWMIGGGLLLLVVGGYFLFRKK